MGNSSSNSGSVAYTVAGTGIEGVETPTWRNLACDRNGGELLTTPWPGVTTLHDAFVYVHFVMTTFASGEGTCSGALEPANTHFCLISLFFFFFFGLG